MMKIKSIFFTLLFLGLSSFDGQIEAYWFTRPFMLLSRVVKSAFPFTYSKDPFLGIYQEYTHKFMETLGYSRAKQVHVFEMSSWDDAYRHAAAYSDPTGIILNLNQFKHDSIATNLFECAHEAAHIALGHTYIVHHLDETNRHKKMSPPSTAEEQEADIAAARMLCNNGYRWVVEGYRMGLIGGCDVYSGHASHVHAPRATQREYLAQVLRETRAIFNVQESAYETKIKITQATVKANEQRTFGKKTIFMLAIIATAMAYKWCSIGR